MLKALQKTLSVLTALAAVAYSLGWLKTFTYFQTFGIGASSLNLTVQDYLFESWYVVENVAFGAFLLWILQAAFPDSWARLQVAWAKPHRFLNVILTTLWFVILIVLAFVFLILPYATESAFSHLESHSLVWLIANYNSLLKFLPFGLLLVIFCNHRCNWTKMEELFRVQTDRYLLLALCLMILFAWSISLAKHIGAIDANSRLRDPGLYFPQVVVHMASNSPNLKPLEDNKNLYEIWESPKNYFFWDHAGFVFERGKSVQILVVPMEKIEWIQSSKLMELDPGSLFNMPRPKI